MKKTRTNKRTIVDVLEDILIEIRQNNQPVIGGKPTDIPISRPGYRTINMRKGSTVESLIKECKKLFPVYVYVPLPVTSDRAMKQAYSVEVKDVVEADEDLKNLSADHLKKKAIQGITLEERLQLELDYFKKTGQHLDIENITLCSGSRNAYGGVPSVCWDDGELFVDWCNPGDRHDALRTRQAVS